MRILNQILTRKKIKKIEFLNISKLLKWHFLLSISPFSLFFILFNTFHFIPFRFSFFFICNYAYSTLNYATTKQVIQARDVLNRRLDLPLATMLSTLTTRVSLKQLNQSASQKKNDAWGKFAQNYNTWNATQKYTSSFFIPPPLPFPPPFFSFILFLLRFVVPPITSLPVPPYHLSSIYPFLHLAFPPIHRSSTPPFFLSNIPPLRLPSPPIYPFLHSAPPFHHLFVSSI